MVADSVEVVTVSPEEEQARQISLRSVHGKYLIRLLNKTSEPAALALGPHGTSFRLRFRRSARKLNVLNAVRRWILFPRCQVTVAIDGSAPVQIGYTSPKAAIETLMTESSATTSLTDSDFKVEERTIDGVTLAYALRFSTHFRDWSFVVLQQSHRPLDYVEQDRLPIGTCVEGIAVEFETPGFRDAAIVAIANAVGASAPKTNVARSSIEATDEKEKLASIVYKILFDAVTAESKRLRADEAYSLTWSTEQMPFLIAPAISPRTPPMYPRAHQSALENVPMFLVEYDNVRAEKSLADLIELSTFWTVESALTRSVENFIREARAEVTARSLLEVSQGTSSGLPPGAILANSHVSEVLRSSIATKFEVTHVSGHIGDRRLDLQWRMGSWRWVSRDQLRSRILSSGNRDMYSTSRVISESARRQQPNVFVPIGDVTVSGLDQYVAAMAYSLVYLIPNTPLSQIFSSELESEGETTDSQMENLVFLEAISQCTESRNRLYPAIFERFFRTIEGRIPSKWLKRQEQFLTAVESLAPNDALFNPLSWGRREPDNARPSYHDTFSDF